MNSSLKWPATFVIILGTLINSAAIYPLGPIVLLLGSLLWLIVGLQWRENSIIVTNGFMIAANIIGLAYRYCIG